MNKLQKKTYRLQKNHLLRVLVAMLGCTIFAACTNHAVRPSLTEIDSLLWTNPQQCADTINQMEYSNYPENIQYRLTLKREHAMLRLYRNLATDSTLLVLNDYFEKTEDWMSLAETNYLLGRYQLLHHNATLATYYLKVADHAISKLTNPSYHLRGIIYYSLGASAEQERMYSIANEYYYLAIPYLQRSGDSLYLYSNYRDIARTLPDTQVVLAKAYLDTSMLYCPQAYRPLYSIINNVMIGQSPIGSSLSIIDSAQYLRNCQYLCDSLRLYGYAVPLFQEALAQNQEPEVQKYLHFLSQDTAGNLWATEQYLHLKTQYLKTNHRKDSALSVYETLYQWLHVNIESSLYDRTYIIAQRYDADNEKKEKLLAQARTKQNQLLLMFGFSIFCLVVVSLVFIIYRKEQKISQEAARNMAIERELNQKRQALNEKLKQRLLITAKIKQKLCTNSKLSREEWEKRVQELVFIDEEQWKKLQNEFNDAYPQFVERIQATYPLITIGDIRYLILLVLDCPTEAICILSDFSKRTAWNRKQVLKQHLQLDADADLDAWIKVQMGGK